MNLVDKTLGGRYEILEQVGVGGMAIVYKARCNLLNRYVAVKVLKQEFAKDAEFVKRFRAEAQSAASLTHPNIVSVYDVGEENGINYIVMEFLEGDTIKDFIDKKGKLSNELTLKFASQIASALEAAHGAKIIHRDIKPQNIVLANNNTIAKVTDFGIAKMSSKDTITTSTATIGSVHYFSPEHAKGCYTDEKSDIYSLGVVMYEMATGVLPFNADSPVTVALKQIQERPLEPKEVTPSVSEMLNDIIMKCMAKNASDRYQTATELLDDIFAAINSRGLESGINMAKDKNSLVHTQVVPIIGLKDDERPSIADERPFEVIESKLTRNGKKLSDIEEEKLQHAQKSKKKMSKAIKVAIVIISIIVVTGAGLIAGNLIFSARSNREQNQTKIEIAPKLVGEKYEDMKLKYKELGIAISVSKYEENADVPEGYIIEQSVKEGEKIKSNGIEVVVSKGVKKIEMLEVVGKDYTVAKYELESIGFLPEFEFVKNEKIEKNIIISQALKKGEQVVVGTKVKIQVSEGNGKLLVIIPSVIGNTEAKAKSIFEEKKLKVSILYANDISKADGTILSQSIKENSEVEEGTTIELTVNRLEKTKTINISLSNFTEGVDLESVVVKVTAQVEGVTNTIYSGTHSKQESGFQDFTVDINGFTTAKIIVYVNDEIKEQKTILFE